MSRFRLASLTPQVETFGACTSTCIGVASSKPGAETAETLLKADDARYRAKSSSGSRYEVHAPHVLPPSMRPDAS